MLTIIQFAAKFNSSIPGTLPTNNSSERDIRNVTDAQIDSIDLRTTSSTSAMHITTLVANSTRGTHTATTRSTMMTIFDSPSTNILVIVLTVGGTIILNISIMIACVVIWFRSCRSGQLNCMVAQPQNQGITIFTFYKIDVMVPYLQEY